jgi:hypothetical protein
LRASTPQRPPEDDSAEASRIDTVYDPKTDSYVPKGPRDRSHKE